MNDLIFYLTFSSIAFVLLGILLLSMGVRLETKRRTEKRFTDLEIKTKALEKLVIEVYKEYNKEND